MEQRENLAPVLKWAGGKRQLLDDIMRFVPPTFDVYHEPFLGGGAVLFALRPQKALVNDINPELMNVYKVIREDVEGLIECLQKHAEAYGQEGRAKEYFYKIRGLDRRKNSFRSLTPVQRASRVIFLNKTCFNGLFRVNKAGQFNTPFGYYDNPCIADGEALRAVSRYFNSARVDFVCGDFGYVTDAAKPGDFVYLDPPYDPVSDTANFTGYDKGGFGQAEQVRLNRVCRVLDSMGIKFLLSNSATDLIFDLYQGYHIDLVRAKRAVNARGDGRGEVDEVLVHNYPSP